MIIGVILIFLSIFIVGIVVWPIGFDFLIKFRLSKEDGYSDLMYA